MIINPYAPDYAERLHEILDAARAQAPVLRADDGVVWVTGHDEARRVFRDEGLFSSVRDEQMLGITNEGPGRPANGPIEWPWEDARPYHDEMARLLSPAASIALRPAIRDASHDFLTRFAGDRGINVVKYADYVPAVTVLRHVIGLPDILAADWHEYSKAVHDVTTQLPGERFAAAYEQFTELGTWLGRVFAARVAHGSYEGPMLMSRLAAGVKAKDFDFDRSVATLMLVITGGIVTTGVAVCYAAQALADGEPTEAAPEPDLGPSLRAAALRSDTWMGMLADELLRLSSPATVLFRTVTEPAELGGVQLERGDRVAVSIAGANRDPAVRECPHRVVLDRSTEPADLTFGAGLHRCVGAHLARVELMVMLDELWTAYPRYRITEAHRPPNVATSFGWDFMMLEASR